MKKVAILLPGLVRTYKKTYKNFFSNIVEFNKDKYEIDIYLAFWNYTHQRGDLGAKEEVKKIDNKEIKEILDIYSPKNYLILEDYHHKNNKEFLDISKNIVKTIGTPNHPDGASLIQNGLIAQTYSWYKAYSIIEGSYDLIFKFRFDSISEEILFDEIKYNYYNCAGPEHQYSQYGLADIIFSGNQDLMYQIMFEYHCDIASNRIGNISNNYPNVFPEFVLKETLKKKQIPINYLNKKVFIIR